MDRRASVVAASGGVVDSMSSLSMSGEWNAAVAGGWLMGAICPWRMRSDEQRSDPASSRRSEQQRSSMAPTLLRSTAACRRALGQLACVRVVPSSLACSALLPRRRSSPLLWLARLLAAGSSAAQQATSSTGHTNTTQQWDSEQEAQGGAQPTLDSSAAVICDRPAVDRSTARSFDLRRLRVGAYLSRARISPFALCACVCGPPVVLNRTNQSRAEIVSPRTDPAARASSPPTPAQPTGNTNRGGPSDGRQGECVRSDSTPLFPRMHAAPASGRASFCAAVLGLPPSSPSSWQRPAGELSSVPSLFQPHACCLQLAPRCCPALLRSAHCLWLLHVAHATRRSPRPYTTGPHTHTKPNNGQRRQSHTETGA